MVIEKLTNKQINKAVKELGHQKVIIKNKRVMQYIAPLKKFNPVGSKFERMILDILDINSILPDDIKAIKSQLTVINDNGGFRRYVEANEILRRIRYQQILKDIDTAYTKTSEKVEKFNNRITDSTATTIARNKLREKGVVSCGRHLFIYDKDMGKFINLNMIVYNSHAHSINIEKYGITSYDFNLASNDVSSFEEVDVYEFNRYQDILKVVNRLQSNYDSIIKQLEAL